MFQVGDTGHVGHGQPFPQPLDAEVELQRLVQTEILVQSQVRGGDHHIRIDRVLGQRMSVMPVLNGSFGRGQRSPDQL